VNTPSHLIITAALAEGLQGHLPVVTTAVLAGSVAPDIPLVLLSGGTFLFERLVRRRDTSELGNLMFGRLFFTNPYWIALHNLLHAPILLLVGMLVTWRLGGPLGLRLFWFLTAALFHTLIDIPTHAEDGPLLLFPFDWRRRFRSPVSYWDPRYHGRVFRYFELALNLVLLIYLVGMRLPIAAA